MKSVFILIKVWGIGHKSPAIWLLYQDFSYFYNKLLL